MVFTCSFERLCSFLETYGRMYPVTLVWMREHMEHYNLFKEKFVGVEGYEQAGIMHGNAEATDTQFQAFYNYSKFDGFPLIVERKQVYTEDDIMALCLKLQCPLNEGTEFCFNVSEKVFLEKQAALLKPNGGLT